MKRLYDLVKDLHSWADNTFGEERKPVAAVYHLKKEVNELIEALELETKSDFDIKEEFADCFLLILNAASKYGLTVEDLIHWAEWKMNVNHNRKWGKPDKNGVVEHIKS